MAARNRKTFYTCQIGGLNFEGLLSADGPYVATVRPRWGIEDGVALGETSLRYLPENPRDLHRDRTEGWYIVKYHSERRVWLPGFGQAELDQLGRSFGLLPYGGDVYGPFFESAAFAGLVEWVASHPRLAKALADRDDYLPRWHRRAVEARSTGGKAA